MTFFLDKLFAAILFRIKLTNLFSNIEFSSTKLIFIFYDLNFLLVVLLVEVLFNSNFMHKGMKVTLFHTCIVGYKIFH